MGPHKRTADPKSRGLVEDLRQAIVKSKLSQYRIAIDTGVPQPVLSRFLARERGLTLETAAKLAAYLRLRLCRMA